MKWSLWQFAVLLTIALTLLLWPSIFDGKVLMPLDLMNHMEPFAVDGAPLAHNHLIGDMLWENLAWKTFQRETLLDGEMPLWNPYSFCGHPLYTTGQTSTFYPPNLILVLIPLPYGYVIFTGLHLLCGGLFTYLFLKRVGVGGFGASVGGTMFALAAYFIVRFIWPMLLGSAIWLPLMLLWIDWMADLRTLRSVLKGLGTGAVLFAMPLLSGFFEIAFYVFFACGLYTLVMGARVIWRERSATDGFVFFAKVGVATVLAVMVAAPQMLPFFEVMNRNVRAGEMTYEAAREKAITWPEALTFAVPDILGNPAMHGQFDVSSRSFEPIEFRNDQGKLVRDWYYFGPQNYVESTNYIGLLPLAFAVLGLISGGVGRGVFWLIVGAILAAAAIGGGHEYLARLLPPDSPLAGDLQIVLVLLAATAVALGTGGKRRVYFALLLGASLAFAFVTPLYALFFEVVPGFDQVRSPWRWTLVTMFAFVYLAAVGADHWFNQLSAQTTKLTKTASIVKLLVVILIAGGVFGLLYWTGPLNSAADTLLGNTQQAAEKLENASQLSRQALAWNWLKVRAGGTFKDASQLVNLLWMNAARVAIVGTAAMFVLAVAYWRQWGGKDVTFISLLAIVIVAVDLGQATFDFNTHSDPTIYHRTPPIVEKLQEAADAETFRIGRFGWQNTFFPNSPTFYGIQDFGGYDSVILGDYASYMLAIEPQHFLPYNFILQFRDPKSLSTPLGQLLNLRYMVSIDELKNDDYEQVDVPGSMRLYRLKEGKGLPRAFFVGHVERVADVDSAIDVIKRGEIDIRSTATVETIPGGTNGLVSPFPGQPGTATIADYRPNRVRIETTTPARQFLVLCDVSYPGWHAYVDGKRARIMTTNGIFRGVSVPAGEHVVEFRFEPPRLRLGLLLSLGTLAGLAVLAIVRRMTTHE